MRFKSDTGEVVDMHYESDLLVMTFRGNDGGDPVAMLRTRGQESTAVIAAIKHRERNTNDTP